MNIGEVKKRDSSPHASLIMFLLSCMKLSLGLMEAIDHEKIEFVVLVSIVFAFVGFFKEKISGIGTGVVGRKLELGNPKLHDCLRHEDAHHEVELFFEDGRGFGVFMEDEGDPLVGGGFLLVGATDIRAGQPEGFEVVFHGQAEFLGYGASTISRSSMRYFMKSMKHFSWL